MKKFTMAAVVVLMAVVFAENTFAAECSSKECISRIKMIYLSPTENGRIFFELKDINPALANCTPFEGKFYTLYKEHVLFDKIYDTAHAAAMMGKEVYFRIIEGSNDCKIHYIQAWY